MDQEKKAVVAGLQTSEKNLQKLLDKDSLPPATWGMFWLYMHYTHGIGYAWLGWMCLIIPLASELILWTLLIATKATLCFDSWKEGNK